MINRKRAKTEDEKEQRRVERVLRNRRAAQSSRERKRLGVEALEDEKKAIERRNKDLEMRLADMEARNIVLQQQLAQITGNMTVFNQPSPQTQPEQYRRAPSPITLSQELFSSRDSQPNSTFDQTNLEAQLNLHPSIQTVNPASISPEIRPVAESSFSNASSSDMTQHPAEVLCDLQCQSEEQRPWIMTSLPTSMATNNQSTETISAMTLTLLLISATTSTILHPLWQILNSLRTASSLSPTPSLLTSIIWLITTPTPLSTPSTSTTSSTPTPNPHLLPSPRFSLRLNLLRRLLACSPQLARPLMDATMAVLRSASDQRRFQVSRDCCCADSGRVGTGRGVCAECRSENREPSIAALTTLLWATYVIDRDRKRDEDRRQQQRDQNGELGAHSLFDAPSMKALEHERSRPSVSKLEEKSCRRSWASSPFGQEVERSGERWEN